MPAWVPVVQLLIMFAYIIVMTVMFHNAECDTPFYVLFFTELFAITFKRCYKYDYIRLLPCLFLPWAGKKCFMSSSVVSVTSILFQS